MRPHCAVVALLFVLLCCAGSYGQVIKRDVIIIGGGASGANTAVFLKDRGYSVAVIEADSSLGGHCDTVTTTGAPPGAPNQIDLGVNVYGNTTWMTVNGFYNYSLKTDQHIKRFVPASAIVPVDFSTPIATFVADIKNRVGIFPAGPADGAAIGAALVQFVTVLRTTYPWLDSPNYPAQIPPELLVDFETFIANNNFTLPLATSLFRALLVNGGMGTWSKLTALYALENLHPATISGSLIPGGGALFGIIGGCGLFYQGIQNFLGSDNVYLDSEVLFVTRPHADFFDNHLGDDLLGKVTVTIKQNRRLKTFIADSLVIAMPQTVDALDNFMFLSNAEKAAFRDVDTRDYFALEVDVQGPITSSGSYNLMNLDFVNTAHFNQPSYPAIVGFTRGFPYGTTPGWAASDDHISDKEMARVVIDQLRTLSTQMPVAQVNETDLVRVIRHVFQPHFPASALARVPNPFTVIANLQGKQNTYYVGALMTFAETSKVLEHAHQLVSQKFPTKNGGQ